MVKSDRTHPVVLLHVSEFHLQSTFITKMLISETSEHLAAQAAAYVKSSSINNAKCRYPGTAFTKATCATSWLSRKHNVNTGMDQTGKRGGNSSIMWAARVYPNSYPFSQEKDRRQSRGQRSFSSFKMSSLASRFVDPVEPCHSTCLCHRPVDPVYSVVCESLCLVALSSSMSLFTVIPQGPFESNGRKQLSLTSCGWVLIRGGQFKITLVAEL